MEILRGATQALGGGHPAGLFFDEDFGETEAATGQFAGVLIADESDTFFADLGEVNFPGFACQGFRIDFGAGCGLARRRLRL